jgi:hypothetical protein
MSWNKWVRQVHRWLSIAFTVTGILPFWVFYVPLLPLFLLMFSGLYMFALPYVAKRRTALPR